MHEFSLAMNILDSCARELEQAGGSKITGIRLEVGSLSGVMAESLRFALEAGHEDNVLKNAQISIDELPARLQCKACGQDFEATEIYTPCPQCGSFGHQVLAGKDLIIKSITIE